jgi:mannose-1-phosphate guanylyltransferase
MAMIDLQVHAFDRSGSVAVSRAITPTGTRKTRKAMTLIPTILCGGAGSRLWPVSRDLHPKPFIRLADGQSLLQKSFLRGAALPGVEEVLTVTNRELLFKTKDEFAEVNEAGIASAYILEPFGRNTAPAIAAAALYVDEAYGPDAVVLVLAADHLISDQAAFSEAVQRATELARGGKLVTFGIEPESPETGYGYIEARGNEVLQFVEKPSLEKAQAYLESGTYLWNSGMFCFTAGVMLKSMAQHCPDILSAMQACIAKSRKLEAKGLKQLELDPESFAKVREDSIDYAVMEKAARASAPGVAVVPCSIGWSDIGSWVAMSELTQPDENGNRVEGEAVLHEVSNSYIRSTERVTAMVGVEGLIVVDTPDALLVASRSRSQDVKQIYARLKAQGHAAHQIHRTVHRPWGTYTVLEEGTRFKIKRIVVKPGATLSLQMHHHRSEHWIVVTGMARVVNGEEEMFVNTNESTYIPAGHKHRLENPGVLDLVMIEVQCGDYLGEDDIVRFQDNYGRC